MCVRDSEPWQSQQWETMYHFHSIPLPLEWTCVMNGPPFLLLLLRFRYLSITWYLPPYMSHYDSYLWLLSDSPWLTMSHVPWPIVQGDSIVPVTPIVPVTLLFSFTISTGSLWPYSLRLDFCILWYRQAIRALSPLSFPCPSCLKVIHSKASDCLSG